MNFKAFGAVAAATLALALCAPAAQSSVIYDNFTSNGFNVGIPNNSYTGVFRSDINQSINQIGARVSVDGGADVKFVLFDLGANAGPNNTGSLVFSQSKHLNGTSGFEYLYSDLFNFSFNAGGWYAVGVIGSSTSAISISFDQATSVNPGPTFTAFANRNVNFANYADPGSLVSGFGCCNIHYQLLSGGGVVPEPGTWALMIVGFGSAGAMLRRRRVASVTA